MKRTLLILVAAIMGYTATFAKQPQAPTSYNYQRGVAEAQDENYEEALRYLDLELKDSPKNAYAYLWETAIYYQTDAYGKALSAADKALQYMPKSQKESVSYMYRLRSGIYLALEDSTAALKDLTSALKVFPADEDALWERGDLYFWLGDYAKSNIDFQQLVKVNAGSVMGYMGLGRNLKEQKQYDQAIEQFSQVIRLSPQYTSGYAFRAECYIKQQKYTEAAEDIISALSLEYDEKAVGMMVDFKGQASSILMTKINIQCAKEPNSIEWLYYKALFLENNNNYLQAIQTYNAIKQLDARNNWDEYIAKDYYKLGDFTKALIFTDKAIVSDSTDYNLLILRSYIYADLNLRDSAILDMNTYIANNPEHYYGYYRRAWYKYLNRQYTEAIEDFHIAIVQNPQYGYAYAERGRSFLALGDTASARADFERILTFDTVPNGESCAPWAYHFLGQDDKAVEFVQRTLDKDSTATYDAACIYALAGDTAQTLYYLQKAFEQGFRRFNHIAIDADLETVRDLPSFKALVNKYQTLAEQELQEEQKDDSDLGEERIVEVPFSAANGVTTVKCSINGLPLTFVFDTGASDVSISQTEASFMYKNGYLSKKDIVGNSAYITADGSISIGTNIILQKIDFGGLELKAVRASVVGNQRAPLLLGQSVLQRLGKIEIDNQRQVLKITTK